MIPDVLIVDDEREIVSVLTTALRKKGVSVGGFTDPELALEQLKTGSVQLVVTDIKMPRMDGLEFLRRIKTICPQCEVIVMTAYAKVDSVRTALKSGALDYLRKPFSIKGELMPLIRTVLSTPRADEEPERGTRDSTSRVDDEGDPLAGIVGRGAAMQPLLDKLPRVARSDAPVMLRGPSGAGKEVIANALHRLSARRKGPLVKVNCAAIPESLLESTLFGYVKGAFTGAIRDHVGFFQAADGGTLFLDEIGEVSRAFQPKLLQALQSSEFHRVGDAVSPVKVDCRYIAATNRNLEEAMAEGTFREDLYYRLNVIPLSVPPLIERHDDLPDLTDHFLRQFGQGRAKHFSPQALEALTGYEWPGNVREFANAIQQAIVLGEGEQIETTDLPVAVQDAYAASQGSLSGSPQGSASLQSMEVRCLQQALNRAGGNRTAAADFLGLTRRAFCYRIKKYGLDGEEPDRSQVRVAGPPPVSTPTRPG